MKKYLSIAAAVILSSGMALTEEYHVAKTGSDSNPGTMDSPFLTIQKAANVARSGDVVTVHAGTYREWVNPRRRERDRPLDVLGAQTDCTRTGGLCMCNQTVNATH